MAARRTEKLARRNPDRLQRQIDDLEAAEASGQPLKPREKKALEDLKREALAVRKARESLGEKAPTFGRGYSADGRRRGGGNGQGPRGGAGNGMLGKRRREGDIDDGDSDVSDTDESIRRIPMPRDTPPPIHPQFLRRNHAANANLEPLGEGRGGGEREINALPQKPEPLPSAQTVYEAKPAVRDLRKEAVKAFVPTVVQRKLDTKRGQGKLLEPEEMDRLEKQGYGRADDDVAQGMVVNAAPVISDMAMGKKASGGSELDAEEARFERELRSVQMEEVKDEDL